MTGKYALVIVTVLLYRSIDSLLLHALTMLKDGKDCLCLRAENSDQDFPLVSLERARVVLSTTPFSSSKMHEIYTCTCRMNDIRF